MSLGGLSLAAMLLASVTTQVSKYGDQDQRRSQVACRRQKATKSASK
jgi:hypothetical protein